MFGQYLHSGHIKKRVFKRHVRRRLYFRALFIFKQNFVAKKINPNKIVDIKMLKGRIERIAFSNFWNLHNNN